jgi:hypothetical protein
MKERDIISFMERWGVYAEAFVDEGWISQDDFCSRTGELMGGLEEARWGAREIFKAAGSPLRGIRRLLHLAGHKAIFRMCGVPGKIGVIPIERVDGEPRNFFFATWDLGEAGGVRNLRRRMEIAERIEINWNRVSGHS